MPFKIYRKSKKIYIYYPIKSIMEQTIVFPITITTIITIIATI
jgi:hypothetical protein